MQSAKLDRKITLERATSVPNDLNEPVQTWTTLATVWAERHDVSDRERLAAAEVSAELTTRFRIRWSSEVADLNPRDRLICEGRVYDISAVKEMGRRDGLEISAAARSD